MTSRKALAIAGAIAATTSLYGHVQALDTPLVFAALTGQENFMCFDEPDYIQGCDADLLCDQNRRCRSTWDLTFRGLWAAEAAYRDKDADRRRIALGKVGLNEIAYTGNGSVGADSEALIASNDEVIIVALAGSESLSDYQTDLDRSQVNPWDNYDGGWLKCKPGTAGCNIPSYLLHEGFLEYAHDVYWSFVRPKLLAEFARKARPVQVVGHSLGGAMAQLLAAQIVSHMGITVDAVVTFGSPMVGDAGWKRVYESTLGLHRATHRWVYDDDTIANFPWNGNWKRSGQEHYVWTDLLPPFTPVTLYALDSGDYPKSLTEREWEDHSLLESYCLKLAKLAPEHPWSKLTCK